jgi:hypothetical protein
MWAESCRADESGATVVKKGEGSGHWAAPTCDHVYGFRSILEVRKLAQGKIEWTRTLSVTVGWNLCMTENQLRRDGSGVWHSGLYGSAWSLYYYAKY